VTDPRARVSPTGPRWLDRHDEDKPVRIPLTRRRIVEAALAIVERDGLPALTIRQLASALNVAPMSLYSHVTDKAELVDLMVDFVIGGVLEDDGGTPAESGRDARAAESGKLARAAESGKLDWVAELRRLSLAFHDAWAAHRGLVRVYADGVTLGPNGARMTERILAVLRSAGFDDRGAAEAFFLLFHYTIGSLQIAPTRPTPESLRVGDTGAAPEGRLARLFAALPIDEIPHTVAVVEHLSGGEYEFGLEVILTGLVAHRGATATALTPREHEVVERIGKGLTDADIATHP
jgi:AcrR family transcriptional regulator